MPAADTADVHVHVHARDAGSGQGHPHVHTHVSGPGVGEKDLPQPIPRHEHTHGGQAQHQPQQDKDQGGSFIKMPISFSPPATTAERLAKVQDMANEGLGQIQDRVQGASSVASDTAGQVQSQIQNAGAKAADKLASVQDTVQNAGSVAADKLYYAQDQARDLSHRVTNQLESVVHTAVNSTSSVFHQTTAQLAMGSMLAALTVVLSVLLALRKSPKIAAVARRPWPLTVWYDPRSSNSMRVLLYLRETGLPFTLQLVDLHRGEQRTPAYRKLNPRGKVPFLSDGDVELNESAGIIEYLSREYPTNLVPTDAKKLALNAKYIAEFHQYLDPLNIFPLVNAKGQTRDELGDKVDALLRECRVWEGYLEGKDYLTGDDIASSDIMAFPVLAQLVMGMNLPAKEFPNITSWVHRIKERPAAQGIEWFDAFPSMVKLESRSFFSPSSSSSLMSGAGAASGTQATLQAQPSSYESGGVSGAAWPQHQQQQQSSSSRDKASTTTQPSVSPSPASSPSPFSNTNMGSSTGVAQASPMQQYAGGGGGGYQGQQAQQGQQGGQQSWGFTTTTSNAPSNLSYGGGGGGGVHPMSGTGYGGVGQGGQLGGSLTGAPLTYSAVVQHGSGTFPPSSSPAPGAGQAPHSYQGQGLGYPPTYASRS